MINNTYSGPKLDLAGVGKPKVQGITNLSLVPDSVKKNASLTTTKPAAPAVSPAKAPVAPAVDRNAELERIKNEALRIQSQIGQMKPEAPVKGLLPSVQGSIKGATPAPAAPTYGGLVQTLAKKGTEASKEFTEAQKAYQRSIDAEENLKANLKKTQGNIYSDDTSFRIMQGRDQALQTATSGQLQAAAERSSQAQNLVTQAQRQQELEQSALTSAAGFAQPSQAQYGQTVFNPLTGQYEGNSGLPPETMQQYAQMAANGQYSSIPSSITSNPVLSAQLNDAARSINPNYNPIASTAQGAAQATNIQTGGTAQVGAASQGYTQAIQSYNTLNTINSSAHAQAENVQQILASAGLNQGIPDYNKAINKLSGKLGSANVQAFNTAIAEMQNMYSQILATGGGTPTGQEQASLMALNPSSSAAQITAAIQQLEIAAYNKLNAQYQQAQQYQNNLGGSTGGQSGNTSGGLFDW